MNSYIVWCENRFSINKIKLPCFNIAGIPILYYTTDTRLYSVVELLSIRQNTNNKLIKKNLVVYCTILLMWMYTQCIYR